MHNSRHFSCIRLPEDMENHLQELVQKVSSEVKTDNRGGLARSNVMDLHITFLLRIEGKNWSIIEQAISEEWHNEEESLGEEIIITLGDLFLSRVNRIQGKEIYAIGVKIVSDRMARLRQKCAMRLDASIGHEGPGHISLCYVTAEGFEAAKELVESYGKAFINHSFALSAIEVRHPDGETVSLISLS